MIQLAQPCDIVTVDKHLCNVLVPKAERSMGSWRVLSQIREDWYCLNSYKFESLLQT